MNAQLFQLFKQIKQQKKELLQVYEEANSLHDRDVIKRSQDLDKLIVQFQKLQAKQKNR